MSDANNGLACSLCKEVRNVRCAFADCPLEVELLSDALAKLRAENEKLTRMAHSFAATADNAENEIAKQRAENERLTEDLRVAVISDTAYCKALEVEGAKLAYEKERLRAALGEARATILQLVNARDSEAEGTDADWVGFIDAALVPPARPESDASGLATQMEG